MSQGDYGEQQYPEGPPPPPQQQPWPPLPPPARRRASTGQIIAAVVAVLAAVPTALGAALILISLTSDGDVHGYGRIFGFLIMVPAGLVFLMALPMALPPKLRIPYSILSSLLLLLVVVLYVAYVRP